MNLSVILNSKFAVAFALVIPAVILVVKMPASDAGEAFNLLVTASKDWLKAAQAQN